MDQRTMNDILQTQSTTGTVTNTTVQNDYIAYCSNRLPCGYCRLMSSMCPLQSHTTITWTTTQAESEMFKIHPESISYATSDINGTVDSFVTKYNPDIPHTYTSSEVQI